MWLVVTTVATGALARETRVPGGVVDAAGHVAYLQGPRGGVEAVEVGTGRVAWSDSAPQRPLAIVGRRLFVEIPGADGPRLALREARAGATPSITSDRVPLPAWAIGASSGPHTFASQAEVVGRDVVRYQWWAQPQQAGGMHPPPEQEALTPLVASGALLFHTTTARLTAAPARSAPFASRSYSVEGVASQEAWIVDGQWCGLGSEMRGGAEVLVVKRATLDGKPLSILVLGPATAVAVRRSVDGAVLALLGPGGTPARLLQLPSGAPIGEVASPELSGQFGVVDGLLFAEVPPRRTATGPGARELRIIDLKTGALRWTHALTTPPAFPPRP